MLHAKLEHFMNDRVVVEIARRQFSPESFTGYIHQVGEELIEMITFSGSGAYDGVVIFYVHDITDILWNSKYLESIRRLILKNGHLPEVPEISLLSMHGAIRDLAAHYASIGLYREMLGEGAQFGQLVSMDDEWVQLSEYSPQHSLNRFHSLARIEHVTVAEADTPYLQDLAFLFADTADPR